MYSIGFTHKNSEVGIVFHWHMDDFVLLSQKKAKEAAALAKQKEEAECQKIYYILKPCLKMNYCRMTDYRREQQSYVSRAGGDKGGQG